MQTRVQYVGQHPQNMTHKSQIQFLPRAASCLCIISVWIERQGQPAGRHLGLGWDSSPRGADSSGPAHLPSHPSTLCPIPSSL